MNRDDLKLIFERIASGDMNPEAAFADVEKKLFMQDGDLNLDGQRRLRMGFDEVIYGRHKTVDAIVRIARMYEDAGTTFFCTGLDDDKMGALRAQLPQFDYIPDAGVMKKVVTPATRVDGRAAVIAAGTSDSRVAREAAETLSVLGVDADTLIDVGVAGIHRLFGHNETLRSADVLIVIAGMEGALPSVVGGMFSRPVIAVPTSVGYGTAMNGFTALFSMLTSCANGITVVNIDNGFGAAMAAWRILAGRPD